MLDSPFVERGECYRVGADRPHRESNEGNTRADCWSLSSTRQAPTKQVKAVSGLFVDHVAAMRHFPSAREEIVVPLLLKYRGFCSSLAPAY